MSAFTLASLAGYLGVMLITWRERGRFFAMFSGVALGIFTLVSIGMQRHLLLLGWPVRNYLQATVYVNSVFFVWPRLRPWPFRLFVNYPASFYVAGTLLGWPFAIAVGLGASPVWLALPYAFALLGVAESLYTRETVRDLVLDNADAGALRRYPLAKTRSQAD